MDNNKQKVLNENIHWALKPEIAETVKEFTKLGIDSDLALAILERLLPENEVYNLPEDEEE